MSTISSFGNEGFGVCFLCIHICEYSSTTSHEWVNWKRYINWEIIPTVTLGWQRCKGTCWAIHTKSVTLITNHLLIIHINQRYD